MTKLGLDGLNLKNKKVLVRVDFNVPLDSNRKITDDTRIVASLPTIKKIIQEGGMAILMSHLGRPKGPDPKLSLLPIAQKLSELLGQNVRFVDDCIGERVEKEIKKLRSMDVLLLENLRFYPEEEKNDPEFAKKLANLADIYVNDAFGTAHRAHASTEGVAKYFRRAAAGYLMQKEVEYLSLALSHPQKPFLAILGGAKGSNKIKVVFNLLDKVDKILIGGGMAFTFLKAKGFEIGNSIFEPELLEKAKEILNLADEKNVRLFLPEDLVIASEANENAETEIVTAAEMKKEKKGLDIGPQTAQKFAAEIQNAKTIFWNGPMGVFEIPKFASATRIIAHSIAEVTQKNKTVSIIGGGDTVASITELGLENRYSHVSTGGGASLEFLEGKVLPGLAALSEV